MKLRLSICLFAFLNFAQPLFANNAAYEQRRTDYINTALANFTNSAITLQAYSNVPLDSVALYQMLSEIATGETSDFDIVKLIRILYFTNGEYDSVILSALNPIPFWVTKDDTIRNYWSENHMIMWMSSDWLLHEKYGKPIDANLDARLRHYLHLKIDYGFYEFFSSVYAPYCLSGLLNLADFAQDTEIKSLATQAAQHLLAEILMLTNDKGVFFPAAGRNYFSKYSPPYGQNHNNLIYLLTGMGDAPLSASHAGAFLASSSLEVDSVIASWSPTLDTLYRIGHTLDSGFVLNNSMSFVDKVVFQWSSGAYFHPDVVSETVQLLGDSGLWNQVDFALLRPLRPIITPQSAPSLATSLSAISMSTVICGQDVSIFKHNSVTLSSVQDFWKGKVGFQQFPCVANVGTTAVFTASGKVETDWNDRNDNTENIHLPYVKQKKNIALLMYRPEFLSELLGNDFSYKDVALHFRDADFDEVVNDSLWILGRQNSSYVAVRRSCTGEINSVRACPTDGGQSWVIMVGDSAMYGSFANFQNIVHQSQFEERWFIDSAVSPAQYVYYAKIVMDTTTIEYAWEKDTSLTTGIENFGDKNSFNIFPNPASDIVTLDVSVFVNQSAEIKVTDIFGRKVYDERMESVIVPTKIIDVQNWSQGIYFVSVENEYTRGVKKLILQK